MCILCDKDFRCTLKLKLSILNYRNLNYRDFTVSCMYFRSYSKFRKAEWETNNQYCDGIRNRTPYRDNSRKLLLDIVDMHIFDFITGKGIMTKILSQYYVNKSML